MRQSTVRIQASDPASDARPGRELSNHTDRSGTTIHGLPAIGFGSLFAVVGVTVGILAWLELLNASSGVPRWLGPMIGGMFAVAGLSFVAHGVLGVRVQRRTRRLRETHERQPWIWDHPWNENGSRDDSGRRITRAMWFTGFLALFMVPLGWIAFFSPERPWPFRIGAVVMGIMVAGSMWWVAYMIRRRAKYGVAMLRFRRFPFRTGEELEVHMARPPRLAGVESPEALLRCVQERYEMRHTGDSRSQVVVAYEICSETKRAEYRRGEYVWRFTVPESAPGTALSERPPRYWELELKIETQGVDYSGTFLVPVYANERRRLLR